MYFGSQALQQQQPQIDSTFAMNNTSQNPAQLLHSISAPLADSGMQATTPQIQRPLSASPKSVSFANASSMPKNNNVFFSKNNLAPTFEMTGAVALADAAAHQRELERQSAMKQTSANPAYNTGFMPPTEQPMSRPSDAPPGFAVNNSHSNASAQQNRVAQGRGTGGRRASAQKNSTSFTDKPMVEEPETTSGRPSRDQPGSAQANMFASPEAVDRQAQTSQNAPTTSSRKRQLSSSSPTQTTTAFTYPPINPSATTSGARNASLPNSGAGKAGAKKHKCPHCDTEFTRHHNLKSHLLTHSQEKPFGCDKCDMRFRRLHDLKRHVKLHTGERPHACDQCGRAFARGDALARHLKGPGGCAGRRESNVNGEDIDGEGDEDSEDTEVQAEGSRRRSEPNKRARRGSHRHSVSQVSQSHGNTYPPVAPMANPDNGPQPTSRGSISNRRGQNLSPNPASMNVPGFTAPQYQNPSVFAQGGLMDSPKPLSPGQPDPNRRQSDVNMIRSPSISTRMQQQPMIGSISGGAGTSMNGSMQSQQQSSAMQIDPRYPQQSQQSSRLPPPIITTQGPSGGYSGPPSAGATSATSHQQGSGSSTRELFANNNQQTGSYNSGQDEVSRLVNTCEGLTQSLRGREAEVLEMRQTINTLQSNFASQQQELHRVYQENDLLRQQNHQLNQMQAGQQMQRSPGRG